MTREPDSFLKLQIRRLATGFCWAVFGIGGLTLSLTAFPVIRAATDSKETSVLRTRRLISASFRLFFRLTHLLGVMEADTAGIQCLKDKKGVILVANHPTLIDYVLIASVIPETDCIVKSALTGNFFLKRVVRAGRGGAAREGRCAPHLPRRHPDEARHNTDSSPRSRSDRGPHRYPD